MSYDHLIGDLQSLILERTTLQNRCVELTRELTKEQARCNKMAQENLKLGREIEQIEREDREQSRN